MPAWRPAADLAVCPTDGTLTDPQGALIPHAEVTVTNTQTGQKFSTVTVDKGHWAIPALPTAVNNLFGQTRSAFNDINSTNDPGPRVMDFQLRFSF